MAMSLVHAVLGVMLLTDRSTSTASGREPETGKGEKHRRAHIPRDEARGLAWLPWKSHGREHGLHLHKVGPDGSVQEIGDLALKPKPKPEAIRMRQARRFAKVEGGRC